MSEGLSVSAAGACARGARPPGPYHQFLADDCRVHHLAELRAEEMERLRRPHLFDEPGEHIGIGLLHGTPGDLDVPAAHGVVRAGVRMDREPGITPQILRLAGARHHAEPQLSEAEVHFESAHPWRTVAAHGGQDMKLVQLEAALHGVGEVGFRRLEVCP